MSILKYSVAALALGLSSIAVAAPTVTKATYVSSPATFTNVFVSGATAQDLGVERAATLLCDPAGGEMVAYRYPASSTTQRVMLCKAAAGLVTTANIAIFKESLVGSGNGVGPVASAATLPFLDIAAATCTSGLATLVTQAAPLGNYYLESCSTNPVLNATTGIGFSDVEPALLGATPAQLAALTVNPTNDLVFGVPVTKVLRDALQTAQGLTSGSDDLDQMPSLTSALLAGIYSGNTTDWAQVSDVNGNALPSKQVKICRRSNSSGTQVTTNVIFLRNPCAGDAALAFAAIDGTNVISNASSSVLRTCMNTRNAAGDWAVGLLSTESKNVAADGWRWVKVDNYAPSLLNVVEGNYKYWAANTIQYRSSDSGANVNVAGALLSGLQTPALVIALNDSFKQELGSTPFAAGYLTPALNNAGVFPTPGSDGGVVGELTDAEVAANPVNTLTRSALGEIKNCQYALPVFETGLTPSLNK